MERLSGVRRALQFGNVQNADSHHGAETERADGRHVARNVALLLLSVAARRRCLLNGWIFVCQFDFQRLNPAKAWAEYFPHPVWRSLPRR